MTSVPDNNQTPDSASGLTRQAHATFEGQEAASAALDQAASLSAQKLGEIAQKAPPCQPSHAPLELSLEAPYRICDIKRFESLSYPPSSLSPHPRSQFNTQQYLSISLKPSAWSLARLKRASSETPEIWMKQRGGRQRPSSRYWGLGGGIFLHQTPNGFEGLFITGTDDYSTIVTCSTSKGDLCYLFSAFLCFSSIFRYVLGTFNPKP